MFWALTLDSSKRYDENFATDVHVSAAVLDALSLPKNSKKDVQVWVEKPNGETLIANLCRETKQIPLDIGFSKSENVTFFTKGESGTVYLHGYFVSDDEGSDGKSNASLTKDMDAYGSRYSIDDHNRRLNEENDKFDEELEPKLDKLHKRNKGDLPIGRIRPKGNRDITLKEKSVKKQQLKTISKVKHESSPEQIRPDHETLHDTFSFHGYSPYPWNSHWSAGSPYPPVHPEALKYQQMLNQTAYNKIKPKK